MSENLKFRYNPYSTISRKERKKIINEIVKFNLYLNNVTERLR